MIATTGQVRRRSILLMTGMPVSSDKERALAERLARLGIVDADLDEQFVRSGGAGGQNVNKVSTCVVLRHVPSGIAVKCQEERSQAMNRFLARRLLADRFEAQQQGAKDARVAEAERIRRQKRKRSKRAKEKMLAAKHVRAEVKSLRRTPSRDD